jgi:hypothetical protein
MTKSTICAIGAIGGLRTGIRTICVIGAIGGS